jgi:Fe-S cluster assembly protein SufD
MSETFNSQFSGLIPKFLPAETESRQKAFDYFKQHGLPSRKNEEWKYTSLQVLEKNHYQLPKTEMSAADKMEINKLLHPDFFHIVFYNGELQTAMSANVPGLKVEAKRFTLDAYDDSLMALNSAMSLRPISMTVADETTISKPVQMLFYSSANEPVMSYPHVCVCVGERSVLTLLEDHAGHGPTATNAYLKITAEKNSHVTYVHCQEQDKSAVHIARTHFEIHKDAKVESLAFSVGAKLSRHTQKYMLQQPGAFVRSLGLYVATGDQHTDHTGTIDHVVGGCTSYQIYKGLIKDQSRGVFNGRVLIRKDSQKAFSEQSNKNLLLSNGAEVDSKPQLEIYADDVQARHGSTVGQLNPEEIFYLTSRAIPKDKAVPMLSFGFLSEILYQLSDDQVMNWLKTKLQIALADLYKEQA